MKILVTGCAGFIGFHLTRKLIQNGHEVVGVDNLNDYYSVALKLNRLRQLGVKSTLIRKNHPVYTGHNFIFIKADMENKALFEQKLSHISFDAVCHLAAQAGVRYSIEEPGQYISSNLQGFFNIIEFCRQRPYMKLIFASSSSVYGKNSIIPYKEDDVTDSPASLYAATKKSNELMAYAYTELYGFEAIALRFFTVYGAWGRPDMAPFLFTDAILKNEPIRLFNKGEMSRDFTYIDDIIEGIIQILLKKPITEESNKKRFRIYNIGNSEPVNMKHFISTIERLTNREANIIYSPMQPGDVKDTWADTTRLQQDYHYKPGTHLSQGLEVFINWYLNYYHHSKMLCSCAIEERKYV